MGDGLVLTYQDTNIDDGGSYEATLTTAVGTCAQETNIDDGGSYECD